MKLFPIKAVAWTTTWLFIATVFIHCTANSQNVAFGEDVFTCTAKISLPNVGGRIDHIAYDTAQGVAFIAALGNNTVEVVNIRTQQVVHTITGLRAPQGIAYIPATNRLVVANDGDGVVIFFDAADFKQLAVVDLKDDADNVRYDAMANLIYVGYGSGGIAIIDAATMQQTANIPLDGHPESFQLDKTQNRIYVNVPDAGKIQVADLSTRRVIADWENTAAANFPMAIDENHHHLFVGCRRPATLRVIDTQTGKGIANLPCSGDADDVFIDPHDSLVFLSAGKGWIDVFKKDQGQFLLVNRMATSSGARTSLWLPGEKKILLAVPVRSGHPAALWVYEKN